MCSDRDCQDSQGCTIGKWDFKFQASRKEPGPRLSESVEPAVHMPPLVGFGSTGLNILLAIALGHPTLRGLEVVDTGYASYQGIQT